MTRWWVRGRYGSQKPKLQLGVASAHSALVVQLVQFAGTDPPGGDAS